ncbi:MAG: aspartate dehydrogenase [Betaproteobacteria bacterium]|nr:aspartate dehydrogenase [Pseudomonadota bacterium]NBP35683.1 aspartate dehydrogenase [Betaproteobacteria bacterium]NBP37965.1 aspartate dehydrogenase [Betaproteobacteria bacterium]NBQ78922.1 aspartate dehydrogenase [Betaproteobacteria bacterium]NBQ94973.1 aspartate dehydrogenase [Betaproteobacteria bacterium]
MGEGQKHSNRVAIAGMGAIGRKIALALDQGIPGMTLTAVAVGSPEKASSFLANLKHPPQVLSLSDLAEHADIVIECAPASVLRELALPVLRAGKTLVILSVGALLLNDDLIALAKACHASIRVPTGALLGLDALIAAAEGEIHSVTMKSSKPPQGFHGAPFLVQRGIDVLGIDAPLQLYAGSAREAATGFPANLNVAIAASLAGIGVDQTRLEIWADPTITRNTHELVVESDSARLTMKIENIPSENPKTGRITAQSVIALLRKMGGHLAIGT